MTGLCISFTSSCLFPVTGGSKKFGDWGGGVNNFRTGGLLIWGEGYFLFRRGVSTLLHDINTAFMVRS